MVRHKFNTLHIVQIKLYSVNTYSLLLMEVTFSFSTLLHDWQATTTSRTRFSLLETILTDGIKWGGQTLEAIGNSKTQDNKPKIVQASNVLLWGEKKKEKKKKGKTPLES